MIAKPYLKKALYFFAICFAFSTPLSRAGINISGFMLLILWLLEGDFKAKYQQIIRQKFLLSLLLFCTYMTISYLWIEPKNYQEAIAYDFKYIYFLIIPILYTSFESDRYRDLLYAFLAGLGISLLQSFAVYFQLYDFHEVNAKSLSVHMWHTIYSIFLAFSGLMTIVLANQEKRLSLKITFIVFSIMIALVLFLGISRTGQSIYLVGLLTIMIRYSKLKYRYILAFIALITLLLVTLYQHNPRFHKRLDIAQSDIQNLTHKNYCTSLGGRIITWKIAAEVFEKEPILGMGTQDHLIYLQERMNAHKTFSNCSIKDLIGYYHAQYIEITAQLGIVGLLLFLNIFYALAKTNNKNPAIAHSKMLFILVFLLASFLDVPFRKMFTLALFALISSIILLEEKKDEI